MNILEAFDSANNGTDVKVIKKGLVPAVQQQINPNRVQLPGAPPPVQQHHAVECVDDFDGSIGSIINQLKSLMSSYDLDEEDHEKISSAIMKLDCLLPDGYVQSVSIAVSQSPQTTAPEQHITNQGSSEENVAGYLQSML